MLELRELDEQITYFEQLGSDDPGPVVLVNVFHVAPDDADALLAAWIEDARFMSDQPGYRSTQLHRGITGSATFVNVAEWDSTTDLRTAFSTPEFQQSLAKYPDSTVAAPHLFRRVEVPGICPG
jgi:heme-degrading monooxygenase HmoA